MDYELNLSEIFDEELRAARISTVSLAEKTGLSKDVISRFRNGTKSWSSTLEKLIPAIPIETRQRILMRINGGVALTYKPSVQPTVAEFVSELSPQEADEIMRLISERFILKKEINTTTDSTKQLHLFRTN